MRTLRLSLAVRVGGVSLEHPVMNASGVLGADASSLLELDKAGVAALVTKSFTREAREGHPTPIIVPVEAGYVNSVGLANPGLDGLVELLSSLRRVTRKPIIVSIAASTPEEADVLASAAKEAGASAIEVNLSCPHSKGRGLEVGYDREASKSIVEAVSRQGLPTWVKLGLLDRLPERAAELIDAGASAVVLINTIRAMVIDVESLSPVLGGKVGGLSGRAIHPVAVRAVYDVYCEYGFDIVGVGGVYDWRGAVELIAAGARAVQVGTALFEKGLSVVREIVDGLAAYMVRMGFRRIDEFVGAACRR